MFLYSGIHLLVFPHISHFSVDIHNLHHTKPVHRDVQKCIQVDVKLTNSSSSTEQRDCTL